MVHNIPENLPALTTEQMKELDRLMVEDFGIGLVQMMENAGRNFAELARRFSGGDVSGRRFTILCGTGNNGGGGMVAARTLHNWGARVRVLLVGEAARLKSIPALQWKVVEKLGLSDGRPPGPTGTFEPGGLILDALLGYGAVGDPRPPVAEWITWANASGFPILSLDSPSGLNTTTGQPGSPCIRATATLTLALPKTGLVAARARPYVGELYLADIGVPRELYASPSLDLLVAPLFARDSLIRLG